MARICYDLCLVNIVKARIDGYPSAPSGRGAGDRSIRNV